MDRKLRKYQDMMIVTGSGVIVFGVWSIIKGIFYSVLKSDYIDGLLKLNVYGTARKALLYAVMFFFMTLDAALRVFIGSSARAEGLGRKRGALYIVAASLLVIFSAAVMIIQFLPLKGGTYDAELLVAAVVELTSLIIMIELIVSSIIVRSLRKKTGRMCHAD